MTVCSGVAVYTTPSHRILPHLIPPSVVYCSFAVLHTPCLGNLTKLLFVCSLAYFVPSPGSCVPCPRHYGEEVHLLPPSNPKNNREARLKSDPKSPKPVLKARTTLYSPQTSSRFGGTYTSNRAICSTSMYRCGKEGVCGRGRGARER